MSLEILRVNMVIISFAACVLRGCCMGFVTSKSFKTGFWFRRVSSVCLKYAYIVREVCSFIDFSEWQFILLFAWLQCNTGLIVSVQERQYENETILMATHPATNYNTLTGALTPHKKYELNGPKGLDNITISAQCRSTGRRYSASALTHNDSCCDYKMIWTESHNRFEW